MQQQDSLSTPKETPIDTTYKVARDSSAKDTDSMSDAKKPLGLENPDTTPAAKPQTNIDDAKKPLEKTNTTQLGNTSLHGGENLGVGASHPQAPSTGSQEVAASPSRTLPLFFAGGRDTIVSDSIPQCILRPGDNDGTLALKASVFSLESVLHRAILSIDSCNQRSGDKLVVEWKWTQEEPAKSYFSRDEYVTVQSSNEAKVNWQDNNWLFWPLFLATVFFAWLRYNHSRFINQTIVSTVNSHISNRLLRERNESTAVNTQWMILFYFVSISLFAFEILNYVNESRLSMHGLVIIPMLCLVVALVYLVKIYTLRVVGYIFEYQRLSDEYIHIVQASYITLGVLVYPITVMVPFLDAGMMSEAAIIMAGIVLYLISFLQRLLRAVLLSINQNISFFYIFLYLCTLEILPLAVLFKAVYDVSKML